MSRWVDAGRLEDEIGFGLNTVGVGCAGVGLSANLGD